MVVTRRLGGSAAGWPSQTSKGLFSRQVPIVATAQKPKFLTFSLLIGFVTHLSPYNDRVP